MKGGNACRVTQAVNGWIYPPAIRIRFNEVSGLIHVLERLCLQHGGYLQLEDALFGGTGGNMRF